MAEKFGYMPDYMVNGPIRSATPVKLPQVPGPVSSAPGTSMRGRQGGLASSSTMGNPAASRLAELAASPAYAGTSAVRSVKPLPYAGPLGEIKTLDQQNALQDYLRTASPKSFVGGDRPDVVSKNIWATGIGGGKEADFNYNVAYNTIRDPNDPTKTVRESVVNFNRPQGILYSPVKSGIPNTGAVTETRMDVNGNRGPASAPLISMTAPSGKRIWLPVASAKHAETMKSYGINVFGPEWTSFKNAVAPYVRGKQSLIEAFGDIAGLASQFESWKNTRSFGKAGSIPGKPQLDQSFKAPDVSKRMAFLPAPRRSGRPGAAIARDTNSAINSFFARWQPGSHAPVQEPEQQMTYGGGITSGGQNYPPGYNPVSGYMPLPFGDSNSERRY